ncbi:redoxin domain-containing protein [Planococcus sp. ISL-110]|uniref:redoxin domain-containing protein n=1 Tax=Planococcus sp. ISL-110 TaxID=2819167 RepID=UPI001BE93F9C|nr:redoxin domain-containing protein [Planococcus sp. ISL-110]MBT2571757.1 redoxin domain-containing protein [Planococcus sp. ISL-110]
MKKMILGVIITAMVGWAIYDLLLSDKEAAQQTEITEAETAQPETTGLAVGDLAPDFELMTLDGQTVRLSDYRGQRVFINFWATWCPPCRAEMPDMQQLYEEQDVPVEILAVNLTASEKSEENVSDFVKDFGLSFPILMDTDSETASKYKVKAVPASYMIDSNGRIAFVAPGAMNKEFMAQEVKKMK